MHARSRIVEPSVNLANQGSHIATRGTHLTNRGSRIANRSSRIDDPGSRIDDRSSCIDDRNSRIDDYCNVHLPVDNTLHHKPMHFAKTLTIETSRHQTSTQGSTIVRTR
jgi:hypothetical protein